MKKENFDLVLQVGTTLILAYVSLGGSPNNPLDEESVLKTCLQVKLYAAPFLCSLLLFRSTPSVFLPTMIGNGITTLPTTMLQTPTSLSGDICERPSHGIDFDLPYDRLPGGLISCSVAFGSSAIQVNWTLVTRHCLPKTMCNCTTLKGPGVEHQESGGLGCGAAVCGID